MRIQIVGTSGSGKSTFANKLADLTGVPRIEIDNLQFEPNWVKRSDEDFDRDLTKALQQPNWIACGNYLSSSAQIHEKSDLIIWLHYPLWKIMWRVTKRTLRRIWSQEPICNGNVETIGRQFFSKYSIFRWVLNSHGKRQKMYTQISSHPSYKDKWIVVRNDQQAEECLKNVADRLNDTGKSK